MRKLWIATCYQQSEEKDSDNNNDKENDMNDKRFSFFALTQNRNGDVIAHCTHLQISQADKRPTFAKECNFC